MRVVFARHRVRRVALSSRASAVQPMQHTNIGEVVVNVSSLREDKNLIGEHLDELRSANDRGELQCIANVAVTTDGYTGKIIGTAAPEDLLDPLSRLLEQLLRMTKYVEAEQAAEGEAQVTH